MLCPTKKMVNLKARIRCGDSTVEGFTNSICEDGLYMRTLPLMSDLSIAQGSFMMVELAQPGMGPVNLYCRVKWVYKTPPHGLTYSIGMEIVDALQNYKEMLKELLN
ncbi:MAG: hypothetical protein HY809_06085 [Nitrospirae bacterium]|nr:hypothetical protein [Nitrospirota bacterium]